MLFSLSFQLPSRVGFLKFWKRRAVVINMFHPALHAFTNIA